MVGGGPELTLLTPFNIDNIAFSKVLVPFGFHSVDFYLQTLTVTLYVFFLKINVNFNCKLVN